MTEYQPKPQTPEQVADGLRDAFRQAIKDGVMDATPYLKQMTYKSDIEKTEAEIKVLQKKLELLKEIETHKSQPRMEAEKSGEVHIVSYNKKTYYRIEYTDEYGYVVWWRREKEEDFWDNASRLVMVTDKETERLLEGLWFNDVKKEKYDDVVDEHKSPVEEAYKDWGGQYPELETDSEYDDMRWKGFQAGFQAAYEEKVREDDYYKPKPTTLFANLDPYSNVDREHICSIVAEWLPKEHDTNSYKWNECLKLMREKLR
jgi:hypothetical protein